MVHGGLVRCAKALGVCSQVMGNCEKKFVSREAFVFAIGRKDRQSLCIRGNAKTFVHGLNTIHYLGSGDLFALLLPVGGSWLVYDEPNRATQEHLGNIPSHIPSHTLCA